MLERPFAHCYETGGMRRTHLRGHPNILKRLLIRVAGFNLGLLMRTKFGIGKPRALQEGLSSDQLGVFDFILGLWRSRRAPWALPNRIGPLFAAKDPTIMVSTAA